MPTPALRPSRPWKTSVLIPERASMGDPIDNGPWTTAMVPRHQKGLNASHREALLAAAARTTGKQVLPMVINLSICAE